MSEVGVYRTKPNAGAATWAESQRFPAWAYPAVSAAIAVGIAAVSAAGVEVERHLPWMPLMATVVGGAFVLNALRLRTRVDAQYVTVQLGWFPVLWRRIPMARIRSVRAVQYHPLRDAGGWGWRFGRFEGAFTIYWNARGDRGVLIETDMQRFVIGSQDPESLRDVITSALCADSGLDAGM